MSWCSHRDHFLELTVGIDKMTRFLQFSTLASQKNSTCIIQWCNLKTDRNWSKLGTSSSKLSHAALSVHSLSQSLRVSRVSYYNNLLSHALIESILPKKGPNVIYLIIRWQIVDYLWSDCNLKYHNQLPVSSKFKES